MHNRGPRTCARKRATASAWSLGFSGSFMRSIERRDEGGREGALVVGDISPSVSGRWPSPSVHGTGECPGRGLERRVGEGRDVASRSACALPQCPARIAHDAAPQPAVAGCGRPAARGSSTARVGRNRWSGARRSTCARAHRSAPRPTTATAPGRSPPPCSAAIASCRAGARRLQQCNAGTRSGAAGASSTRRPCRARRVPSTAGRGRRGRAGGFFRSRPRPAPCRPGTQASPRPR